MVTPKDAVEAILALLALIAERGPEARASDLALVPAALRSRLEAAIPFTPPRRADAIGLHLLKDGAYALGLGLAFGHAHAEALSELALTARKNGAVWVRPAPGRALLLGPLSRAKAAKTRQVAANLGFVTEASDPRRRIAACPGAPFCAYGLIAARALAAEIARHVPLAGERGILLHVSGCCKGCAHPAPAPLTVVGTEKGCGLVRNGVARAVPTNYVDPSDLIAALRGATEKTREAAHA